MKRRIFTLTAALSATLFLLAGGMWIRSYWRSDAAGHATSQSVQVLSSRAGNIRFWTMHFGQIDIGTSRLLIGGFSFESIPYADDMSQNYGWNFPTTGVPVRFQHFGWEVRSDSRPSGSIFVITTRHWSLMTLAAPLPICWLISTARRRRRNQVGKCSNCGYNLTGNLSGTCPECGTPLPSTPLPST